MDGWQTAWSISMASRAAAQQLILGPPVFVSVG